MADVYQHAAITLSATSSPGDTQGCFTEDPTSIQDLEINLPEDVGACQIAVRKPLKHWNNLIPSLLQKHFPLLSRGWAFQERILAPRVLHFCESELVWECRQTSVCECGGLGEDISPGGAYYNAIQDSEEEQQEKAATTNERLDQLMAIQLQQEEEGWIADLQERADTSSPSSMNELPLAPPYIKDLESSDSESDIINPSAEAPSYDSIMSLGEPEDVPDIVRHFNRIVEQYSALRLTKPTDRLLALSGLCKRVQHLRGDYIAGMWSDSLCYDLLWRVNTLDLTSSSGSHAIEYRGPSWSWVTSQSAISYWNDIVNFRSSNIRGMRQFVSPETRVSMSRAERNPLDPGHLSRHLDRNPIEHLGQYPDRASVVIEVAGHNPFGQISSAVLEAEASATTATLLYTYDTYWLGQTNNHDSARYKLRIRTSVSTDGNHVDVPFFADYALGVDGPYTISEGTELTLMLVHPKVALVLKPKSEGNGVWERVGIARISEALRNYYRLDWMRASEVMKFSIV